MVASWYLRMLKTHPWKANLGSSLIVMAFGDIMAQEIEIHQKRLTENEPRKISFRRYGTLSPNVEKIRREEVVLPGYGATEILISSDWKASFQAFTERAMEHISMLDSFRTLTMVIWSVTIYTPYFIGLYKVFDRVLPHGRTFLPVMSRVFGSFVAAIPINAAFFCFGSYVHHATEWIALANEQALKESKSLTQSLVEIPFDLQMAWSTARLKLEAELLPTVQAAAVVWIPINVLNFSAVPPHLRPLTMMICSAFWNCYLSLAQHRDEVY